MANIPSVNRTLDAYSRLNRKAPGKVVQTKESTPQVDGENQPLERRRIGDRRRRNLKVLFNRRRSADRRSTSRRRSPDRDDPAHRARKGSRINTTA